ncbi:MAG: hypothetical protein LUE98_09270 [Tannerellaceae bacterium]|nr:hypothetical protein [Tannerellaceae bacterium]
MKKDNLLYVIFIFLCLMSAQGQVTTIQMPSVTPPSPNVRNFLKFDDHPVTNYTGTVDVNIPIHTIELKNAVLPISLSYNTSGIRVEEEASRVGLGWVLNAGGMISHTVMGRYHDFCDWAYFTSSPDNKLHDIKDIYNITRYTIGGPKSYLPFTLQRMTHESLYTALCSDSYRLCGGTELAPDIYHYQFGGYSGKFIFSHDGNIVKEKEDNVRITPIKERNSHGLYALKAWTAITPDGTEYSFNETEMTTFVDRPKAENYNSCYYLTSIKGIDGTVIKLNYEKRKAFLGAFNRVQDSTLEGYFSASHAYYEVVYLDNITYPGGKVRFEYKFDRTDYQAEARLTTIYLDDETGINKSKWILSHGYFTANVTGIDQPTLTELNNSIKRYSYYNNTSYDNSIYTESWNTKRLKLSALEHISGNKKGEVYKFTYNEDSLPTKLSTSMDHWGYYNGAKNTSLIPPVKQNISQLDGEIEISTAGLDADREPNTKFHQAFVLKEIINPTGGKTIYNYGAHDYPIDHFENDPHKKDLLYSEQVTRLEHKVGLNNAPIDWVQTESFSLPVTPEHGYKGIFSVKLRFTLDNSYNSRTGITEFDMSIVRTTGAVKPWSFTYHSGNLPVTVDDRNRTLEMSWNNLETNTGDYEIRAVGTLRKYIKEGEIVVKRIIYPSETLQKNSTAIGGGLRISSIYQYDLDGKTISSKTFNYNNSGKLMNYPHYRKDYKSIGSNGLRGNGYSVGYSKVKVSTDSREAVTYEYINIPDLHLIYKWWDNQDAYGKGIKAKDENPPGIGAYKYSENGTVLKETIEITNSGSNKQKETEYTYAKVGDGPHIIWGVLKNPLNATSRNSSVCYSENTINTLKDIYGSNAAGYLYSQIPWGYLYPAIRPMQLFLDKKKETFYENDKSTEIITEYFYNHTYNCVTKEEVTSGGKKIKTVEYKYPFDYPTNSVMAKLTEANRMFIPVETKQTIEGKSVQVTNEYALFNNKPWLSVIKSNTGEENMMESRVTYHQYDTFGNPLYITKDEGLRVVYLWGYTGQYPIAEIKNTTYEEVKSALGVTPESISAATTPNFTLIESLRSKLQNTHVTIYTYKPQVGILTMTDESGIKIHYAYDEFARLKEIYRMEGTVKTVLQSYEYNYSSK